MQEFEYRGMWWHPQFPDHKVAGILSFHPAKGAFLRTLGTSFDNLKAEGKLEHVYEIGVIWGCTSKGDLVTLNSCETSGSGWAPGYSEAVYSVKRILVGYHLKKDEDVVFESMSVSFSNLEHWLELNSFRESIIQREDFTDREIKLTWMEPFGVRITNFHIASEQYFQVDGDETGNTPFL